MCKLSEEKSVIMWTDCLDITISVDWDVKPQAREKPSHGSLLKLIWLANSVNWYPLHKDTIVKKSGSNKNALRLEFLPLCIALPPILFYLHVQLQVSRQTSFERSMKLFILKQEPTQNLLQ